MRRFWRSKTHATEVQRAEKQAEAAKKDAEKVKQQWTDVHRIARKSRELREANGWTESIAEIFGGRA